MRMGDDPDVAPLAPESAVRPATRHLRFAPEAHAAATTVAALDEELDPIDEHSSPNRARSASGGLGQDAHEATALAVVFELDNALGEGEERVVLPEPDVGARLPTCSVLAQDDLAAAHDLSAKALHAEALRVAVAPVSAGTLAFLVCHVSRLLLRCPQGRSLEHERARALDVDRVDLERRLILSVPPGLPVVLAVLELEDAHLVVAHLAHNRANDRGRGHRRGSDLRATVSRDHEDFGEGDLVAHGTHQTLNVDRFARLYSVLLATSLDDCVHRRSLHHVLKR